MPLTKCVLIASDTDVKSIGEDPQDVREYAAQKEIDEAAGLDLVMKEKAEEFVAAGGEIYEQNI